MFGNQYQVNYSGLRARPNYAQLIDYLQNGQETIRYPDRFAKQMRNSPYMTQLDGIEIMTQQNEIQKAQDKEAAIRALASRSNQTANVLRLTSSSQVQLTGGRMTGSSEMHQPNRSSGSVGSNDEFLSPTDVQNYDIGTPVRPEFLPKRLNMDGFTSEQQREMDEIIASLAQQDKRRINDIRNIARSGLVNLSKGNLAHKLVTGGREDVQESVAEADPVKPSSPVAAADSSFKSQRDESIERRKKEWASGSSSARNRETSPFTATPRPTSKGPNIMTLVDITQASGSQGSASGPARRERSRERLGLASASAGTQLDTVKE